MLYINIFTPIVKVAKGQTTREIITAKVRKIETNPVSTCLVSAVKQIKTPFLKIGKCLARKAESKI